MTSTVVDRAAQAVEASDTGKGKKVPPSAEVKAAKKPSKYTDETKAACKRAQEIRGKKNAVAPVTVVRVQDALKSGGKTPEQIVKSFKTIKDATAYASASDKSIKAPELVATVSESIADPFARSRGLVSIALALAGK